MPSDSVCLSIILDMSSLRSLSHTFTHHTTLWLPKATVVVMNGRLTSHLCHVDGPVHSWDMANSKFDLAKPRSSSRSYSWASIQSIFFIFISHQSLRSLSHTFTHHTTLWLPKATVVVMNGRLTSHLCHVDGPVHSWDMANSKFDLAKPRSSSRSYSWASIQSIFFIFISHQSDRQSPIYSYFRIWPWKSKIVCEVKTEKLWSDSCLCIQMMHFLLFHVNPTNHS